MAPAPSADESSRQQLRVIDLFAGAGGLTDGFQLVGGFRPVAAVELDVAAAATCAANHGADHVYAGPIGQWLREEDVPEADVVVGGPPCQGFSMLGKRNADDPRNSLWRRYAETLLRARPRWFVLENVAAFLRSPQMAMLRGATEPGGELRDWTFESTVLNAADFGAPQSRRRAVLIGHHRDLPFPGFPTATHRGRHRTVADALKSVPSTIFEEDLPERYEEIFGERLPGPFLTRELHIGRSYQAVTKARIRHIPPGGSRFDIPDRLLPRCWREHKNGSADVMGRLYWDRPAVTIRTEFFKPEKGRYLHPTEDRVITHYEAALLQGFAPTRRWHGTRAEIARQIGNAVPVPLAAALASAIRTAHEGTGGTGARRGLGPGKSE